MMWQIYLIEQADALSIALIIISGGLGIYGLIRTMHSASGEYPIPRHLKTHVLPILIGLILLISVIPSTRSCYRILGIGKTLEFVNNSEEAKKLPENTLKLINKSLEKLNEKME